MYVQVVYIQSRTELNGSKCIPIYHLWEIGYGFVDEIIKVHDAERFILLNERILIIQLVLKFCLPYLVNQYILTLFNSNE